MKPGCRVTHSRVKPAEVMTWSAGVLAPDGAQAETTPPPALPKSITTDTPDEDEHAAAPAGAEAPTSAAVVAVIAMMTATRRRTHPVTGVDRGHLLRNQNFVTEASAPAAVCTALTLIRPWRAPCERACGP